MAQDEAIAERVKNIIELSHDAYLDLIVEDIKRMEQKTFGVCTILIYIGYYMEN